ncbi:MULTISPECIES: acetyl-CoA carboxylase biotin carboxyl carrier protein [Pseudomonadaceae]|uniref:acetyl-CoA carboxylase biotin carboxyl carrier protein n=1 Tax=Pseudomonadaceae TaxID=135621 RepID=UPI0013EB064F|nr:MULTISPECIES: biotin/lipoyl-containing protein [Pseudomonas]QUG92769.1 acetyl-CoA carboxylase biotin carboxyl carrier protein subunit [Pseudomonas putida]
MLTHEDLQEILQIIDATEYHQLSLQTDHFKLIVQRSGTQWTVEQEVLTAPNLLDDGEGETAVTEPSVKSSTVEGNDRLFGVMSPLPGVFYRSPKPGSPPFVEVGSRVEPTTLVCIIESMKLMNSVYAGVAGTVVDICFGDGDSVDSDEVLIRVDPEAV